MNLLQRFCTAVVDASDTWGASMQGVDVQTHRANLYGHPEGIAAARVARENGRAQVATPAASIAAVDRDAVEADEVSEDSFTPGYVARTSDVPLYERLAEDDELEMREARDRDLDGIDSL